MTLKYFHISEFDCSCGRLNCKGENMNVEFLKTLDDARNLSEIPFFITSGYRCEAKQQELTELGYKTAKIRSPHLDGLAADISVTDARSRWIIVNSLVLAGFSRIGISDTFIHVDLSKDLRDNVIFTY